MQFLIESCVEILLKEGTGKLQAFQSHLCSLPVPCSDNIRATLGKFDMYSKSSSCNKEKKDCDEPEQTGTHKEFTLGIKDCRLCIDETDIAAEVLHIFA